MVITIIGILIAQLLPAVQAAREASGSCSVPTISSRWRWLACNTKNQQILAQQRLGLDWGRLRSRLRQETARRLALQHSPLHGVGESARHGPGRDYAAMVVAAEQPVNTFICPTRRTAIAYPFINGYNFNQFPTRPTVIGRSDYAANSRDGPSHGVGWEMGSGGQGNSSTRPANVRPYTNWVPLSCYSPGGTLHRRDVPPQPVHHGEHYRRRQQHFLARRAVLLARPLL